MASTTALFTGLSGLRVHSRMLDTIGNNIANVNTTAFKSGRMVFETMFSRNFTLGATPGAFSGGINPTQIGNGVRIAGVQRDFSSGAFSATGDPRDLAIDGVGFFIVERNGQTLYTRAGGFRQDLEDNLVTISGERLQGYMVDDQFNILEGELVDINIALGKRVIAQQTTEASLAGNLNASGDIPTMGSAIALMGNATDGFVNTAGAFIDSSTLLIDIEDPDDPGSGTTIFFAGQSFELNGASKGDKSLPTEQLAISATTTVGDLMAFLTETLGIHDTGGPNPDGSTPGITVDPATGIISIVGNIGTASDLDINPGDLRVLDANGDAAGLPFTVDKTESADGESVRTTMVVYDSLGAQISVDVTMVLESKDSSGTTWRYIIDSADDTDIDLRIATGTVKFDTFGELSTEVPINVSIDRENTGAQTPLTFELSLTGTNGRTTALADSQSQLINVFRDGLPPGTLETFAVQPDGTIFGGFSNGAVRTLGRIVMATFANQEGLLDVGGNSFVPGPNSGSAVVIDPGTLGAGSIVGGALELSNVDLGQEFIQMILTSTGYSASSRIIRTADELLQQLLVLGR